MVFCTRQLTLRIVALSQGVRSGILRWSCAAADIASGCRCQVDAVLCLQSIRSISAQIAVEVIKVAAIEGHVGKVPRQQLEEGEDVLLEWVRKNMWVLMKGTACHSIQMGWFQTETICLMALRQQARSYHERMPILTCMTTVLVAASMRACC